MDSILAKKILQSLLKFPVVETILITAIHSLFVTEDKLTS